MINVNIFLPRKNFDIAIHETFSSGITGIYGPSGSGKTSLLHAISGLAIPRKGKISICGKEVYNSEEKTFLPVEKRNIGYVFQEGRLFPHMTVEKNLLYGFKKNAINKVRFKEIIEMLNLEHLLKSKPASISGGERQRTALGRSLLSSPDILLLDEPFSAVDIRLRSQILPFIIKIQQKIKIPILVVSHDLPDLLKLTDTLCIIREGKCIAHGEYHQLLKSGNVLDIFGPGTIMNSVTMEVERVDPENGLTILSTKNKKYPIRIRCEKSRATYKPEQELKIFISADDIAISSQKLTGITIQNQLEGTINDIIERDSSILCIVDVGFKLVVEITAESQKRMEIIKGSKVWCLFKSVAIDVAG